MKLKLLLSASLLAFASPLPFDLAHATQPSSPVPAFVGQNAVTITPSDSTVQVFNELYVGTAGNVTVTTAAGQKTNFPNVPAGTVLPISGTLVWSTGTSAGNMVAIY